MSYDAGRSKRILIVEDQPIIAYDLRAVLLEMGHEVLGPAAGMSSAMQIIVGDPPGAAVLDIALRPETSFPIAKALADRGIPFLFLTGHMQAVLPPWLRTHIFLTKPAVAANLEAALESLWANPYRSEFDI